MSENKKTTAPIPVVGAAGEQSSGRETIAIIPKEPLERKRRQGSLTTVSMTELYDTAYSPKAVLIDNLLYAGKGTSQWAKTDSEIKGNRQNSAVTDAVVQEICSLAVAETLEELRAEFEEKQQLLERTASSNSAYNSPIRQISIDPHLEEKLISLLARKIAKPVLTERENLILQMVQDGHQPKIEEAQSYFSNNEATFCREQQREEAKLAKEIEAARKEAEKEKKHFQQVLERIKLQISECKDVNEREQLLIKQNEIIDHLDELTQKMDDIDYRQSNQRAGYVYVISNIGSFGENVYKIGMTRRLDPMERVYELGDASVPFMFDVHAMIFSDDAPQLEAALHQAFANKRVNKVNTRREYFRVSLDEIKAVVKENHDKTVEFFESAEAQQYRESMLME